MFNVVRFTLLRYFPKALLRWLPEPDLRRDVAWGMTAVGVFMIALGRFAAFGGRDTQFTAVLSRMNLEYEWGIIMITMGVTQCLASFLPWRVLQVTTYGLSGLVLLWTYVLTGLISGLITPTVDACLGIGVVLMIGAIAKAQQSVLVRARTQEPKDGQPEYG